MKERKEVREGAGAKIRIMQIAGEQPRSRDGQVGYYRTFSEWASHWSALVTDSRAQAFAGEVEQPPHADANGVADCG